MPFIRTYTSGNAGLNTSKRGLPKLASYVRIGELESARKPGSEIMYHYTLQVVKLETSGFKNFTPEQAEELGLTTTFGNGVYLTSIDNPGSRVRVKVKCKKVVYLNYNDPKSVKKFISLINESSTNADDWYVSKIAEKLQVLGYEAVDIRIDFSKLTKEDLEADLESLFGTEHQLLVFNTDNVEIQNTLRSVG